MSADEFFGFRGAASPQISLLQERDAAITRRLEEARARVAEGERWRAEALEARTQLPELEARIVQLDNELRQTERKSRETKAETARLVADQARKDALVAAAEEFARWYDGGAVTADTRRAALKLLRA